jgi:hypothetical protein
MNEVEEKLIELFLDGRFKSVKNEIKLLRYLYQDYCRTNSPDLVDDILKLVYELLNNLKIESNPINESKFKNPVSLSFYKYMIANGMSPKTANDYVKRVNQICNIEKLLTIDVQPFIDEYTIGDKVEVNKRLHNAPSSALRKFDKFKKENYQ